MSDNNYRDMVPASDKDVKILKEKGIKAPTHKGENKAVYDTKESGTNSYHANNLKMIKDLKKDA